MQTGMMGSVGWQEGMRTGRRDSDAEGAAGRIMEIGRSNRG